MKEIDWSRAPTDATHYNQFACHWIKHLGNGSYQFLKGDEWEMGFGCMDSRYIERPEPEAWSGEGLPPVGTVCELRNVSAGTCWAKAHIKFASRNVVVWDWDGEPAMNGLCTAYLHALEIRPTRTPEKIAAEEREMAISQMAVIALAGDNQLVTKVYLERLYDAGYRKVTP